MNIRDEVISLLDSLGCKYTMGMGLISVTTPDGAIWDLSVPCMVKSPGVEEQDPLCWDEEEKTAVTAL